MFARKVMSLLVSLGQDHSTDAIWQTHVLEEAVALLIRNIESRFTCNCGTDFGAESGATSTDGRRGKQATFGQQRAIGHAFANIHHHAKLVAGHICASTDRCRKGLRHQIYGSATYAADCLDQVGPLGIRGIAGRCRQDAGWPASGTLNAAEHGIEDFAGERWIEHGAPADCGLGADSTRSLEVSWRALRRNPGQCRTQIHCDIWIAVIACEYADHGWMRTGPSLSMGLANPGR